MATPKDYARSKDGLRLQFGGMNTVLPPDQMPPTKFPYGQNIRSYLREAVRSRATEGNALFTPSAGNPVYSLRRLNDSTPNGPAAGYVLVSSAQQKLFVNGAQAAPYQPALKGYPVSLVPFRPDSSVQPWMYVGDSQAMMKVRSDGRAYKTGIAEPQVPASAQVSGTQFVSINDMETLANWHYTGVGVHVLSSAARSTPTVNAAIYDVLSKGEMSLVLNPTTNVLANCILYDGLIPIFIESAIAAPEDNGGTAQISNITYDSGTTGLCFITVANVAWAIAGGVIANGVYKLNAGNPTEEYVRVLSVDLQYPAAIIRCKTVNTHANFETMNGFASFRAYSPATVTVGHVLANKYVQGITDGTGGAVTPVNGMYTLAPAQTASMLGRLVKDADLVHLLIQVDTPLNITGCQVLFNLDPNTPNFSTNAFKWDIDPALFTAGGVWLDLSIAVSALVRIGTNADLSFNTGTFGVSICFTAGGLVTYQVSDIVIVGNDGPTGTGAATGISYYYKWRSSVTGARSNPSPPMRETVGPNAKGVMVQGTPSADPQVDKLDFYRVGGTILDPTYIGTGPNTGDSFPDVFDEAAILDNPLMSFTDFEPFPSIDLPRSGVVNVNGYSVTWVSGDKFNVRWAPGVSITINGIVYALYNRPSTDQLLTLLENGGVQNNVAYSITTPTLLAQPLPSMWGFTDNVNYMFAVGDPLRPGTLYFIAGNNPDAAPDTNQQEVTSPSEPLMNGVIVGGVATVFSTERAWHIWPNFFNALATVTGTQGSPFTLVESISTRGLYARNAICTDGSGNIYFRAKDGISLSPGGAGEKTITDDIYNLFPHEGFTPQPITLAGFTVYPPDDSTVSHLEAQQLRTSDGFLYYDYVDVNGNPRTLVYEIATGGWSVDVYRFPVTSHAKKEGDAEGTYVGCSDGTIRELLPDAQGIESAIGVSVILMPCFNAGDARANKRFGDIYVEAAVPNGQSLGAIPYINLYSALANPNFNLGPSAGVRTPFVMDFAGNVGVYARDIATAFQWTIGTSTLVYIWQPTLIEQPETIQNRPSEWDDGGYPGAKFVQGCIIEADTANAAKLLKAQSGDDLSFHALNEAIVFNGQSQKAFSITPPFIAHTMRLYSDDGVPYRLFGVKWVYQPFPELCLDWQSEGTSHGLLGWQHSRMMNIAHISTADLSLVLVYDGVAQAPIVVPNSGGLQVKTKVIIPAAKFKVCSYRLSSGVAFRHFQQDLEVWVRAWGSEGPYLTARPFGGRSNEGAEV